MKNSVQGSIENYSEKDSDLFNKFFNNLKLSKQYRQEFTEWLPEIAYVKSCDISDVFESEALQVIINSNKLNGPQKLSHIRNELYTMRFPKLSKVRKKWELLTRKNNPDKKNIRFKADPYFEKAGIELTINAENREELLKNLSNLSNIDNSIWDNIIDPFREE